MMRLISILTGLLTLTVALFSFIVSFVSLETISREFDFPIPFLFPLTIEAGVIIFSLNALYRYLNQERTFWQWSLVILSSGLALTFNVLHAQNNWISQAMFAIPSLFFLLAFENFLSQIKYVTKRKMVQNSLKSLLQEIEEIKNKFQIETKEHQQGLNTFLNEIENTRESFQVELKQHQDKLEKLLVNIQSSKTELHSLKIELTQTKKQLEDSKLELNPVEKRRQQIETLYKEGIDKNKIAEQLGVSIGTVYNDIKTMGLNGK